MIQTQCPCGSQRIRQVLLFPRDEVFISTKYIQCLDCGALRHKYHLNSEESKSYYEKNYQNDYGRSARMESIKVKQVRNSHKFIGAIKSELASCINSKLSVIELGSSYGYMLAELANEFEEVSFIGIEPSIEQSTFSQDAFSYLRNLSFYQFLDQLESEHSGDPQSRLLVISHHVIEHILSPADYLSSLQTKVNGTISHHHIVPNSFAGFLQYLKPFKLELPTYASRASYHRQFHFAHIHYFTVSSLLIMFKNLGYAQTNVSCINLNGYSPEISIRASNYVDSIFQLEAKSNPIRTHALFPILILLKTLISKAIFRLPIFSLR